MSVYQKGLMIIVGCAVAMALVAIPLVLRRVPRNRVYGFRTPRTLSDDAIWYAANAHFGRGLLAASVVTAVAVAVLYAAGVAPEIFLKLSVAVLALPLIVAILATFRFLQTTSKKGDGLP